jgi:tetratricopeptide (TPR) repeat protein
MKPSKRVTCGLLAVAVVVAGGLASAPAAGADAEGTARKHAARANKLAAKNKCKLALPWFNRAYQTPKDPSLLFNRAECLRKLGDNHDAVRDYELFLTEMPTAPNRAVVESRIAELNEAIKTASSAGQAAPRAQGPTGLPPAAPGKTVEKPGAGEGAGAPEAKPVDKAPAEPVRRAEKWTD